MVKIKIIYKVYYEDELRLADLEELEREYKNIYGEFNVRLGDYYYLPYPSEETIGKNPEIFSEALLIHFEQLYLVAKSFKKQISDYVAIHYIESPWVWLEFRRINDYVYISELFYEAGDLGDFIVYKDNYFINSNRDKEKNICITVNEFIDQVESKIELFIQDLIKINPLLSKSSSIISFLSRTVRGDIR
ncbi:hypothetical protein [Paenibacillus sp. FSL K6-1230]|uniref:hypothetical protein n=1 Tax=Paenibacillus sp. FSL K6-1230 TaxID=2921603 RepID=UPI0030F4C157